MRSKLIGSFTLALFILAACGSSSDDNGGSKDGGLTDGSSGSGGSGASGTGATGTGATGTGAAAGATGTGAAAGATGTGATGGAAGAGTGGTVAGGTGGGGPCVPVSCGVPTPYECGDCIDNDGDGKIDADDPDCWGACQNNESGFHGDIPGQQNPPCIQDCYFDQNSGAGDDQCYWDHRCDPNEVTPSYYPEGNGCPYDANTKVIISGGAPWSCTQALNTQKPECLANCGPMTPNGCDCFGCCNIPGASTPVWLGSVDSAGNGTCDLAHVGDPTKCHPCEIVKGCFNSCEHCELCIGKTVLPSDCTNTGGTGGTTGGGGSGGSTGGSGGSTGGSGGTGGSCILPLCPSGIQACGVSCAPACPAGTYCVTGCCQKVIT
jgi:hypothetical protein